tara:strand:+ start:23 stop:556 length:534 start_codon:yes stop_codon:yes gene_type:complete
MKDFANVRNSKSIKTKRKTVFRSKKPSVNTISINTVLLLISISLGLVAASVFLFKTDVSSIKITNTLNAVNIDFPSSLLENSVLIEFNEENSSLKCQYFVQVGAYGNKKYAVEAINMLSGEIENLTIKEVYSTLLPGKLLNSVISGPYVNRSAANNAKEKITKSGFEPRLRTVCKEN